jgi:cell division protein FtsN
VSGARTLGRDFKHSKRTAAVPNPAFSGWMGLLVGLAIGLSVAVAVFLHYQRAADPEVQPTAAAPTPAATVEDSDATPKDEPENNKYTFYDDLVNMEVEVPPDSDQTKPSSTLPQGDVILQAGSFKQPAEAEKLLARLARYGVNAKIQRISLSDETWYRVRVGPIATTKEYDEIREKLADADVEVSPVVPEHRRSVP